MNLSLARRQIFPRAVFGNGGIKPIRITERAANLLEERGRPNGGRGLTGEERERVEEGELQSQSRLRYSQSGAHRAPWCRFIRKSRKVARFTRCKARLATTLYTPRRCLSPSLPSPSYRRYPAYEHALARDLSSSLGRLTRLPDLPTLPVKFRYSRSKLPRSLGASLASSLAPLSDFNVVRLRASNQKHERYFCTWSPLFSFSRRLPRARVFPFSPLTLLLLSLYPSCSLYRVAVSRFNASHHQSFRRSLRYPTDISAFRAFASRASVSMPVFPAPAYTHTYSGPR